MKECPAIIAALPREISEVVRGWEKRELPGKIFVYASEFAVAACAGMGAARAALAVEAARAARPVTVLISAGIAGACDPVLRVGQIIRAGVVVDSRTGERFSDPEFRQVLVTAPAIASVREKARLHEAYGASAVDMEAAMVARLARAHDLAFKAIKAISDEANFELRQLTKFATADGQFREAAFAFHAALRPTMWSGVAALARHSGLATKALTTELVSQLERYREQG